MGRTIKVKNISVGGNSGFVLIAGPCVIESRQKALKSARDLKAIAKSVNVPFIFKVSYDKANRTSLKSFRGPGLEEGLEILEEIKETLGVPVLSDVHSASEVARAARVLDVIQIPAFLCRQTDLLIEAGKSKRVVNVKKGQFVAPWDMQHAIRKIESAGNKKILLTERGTTFGYNNLVTDFRSLAIMRDLGAPVIFDASHSVQQPGGLGNASGGQSEFIPLLARCALAAGCDGIFMEVHPNPKKALSDGPNALQQSKLKKILVQLKKIDSAARSGN